MRVFKSRFLHIAIPLLASLAGLLAPVVSCGADALILPRDREVAVSLRPFAGIYEDRSGHLDIDRIRELEQRDRDLFQSAEQLRPSAGSLDSAWWLRATIENRTGTMQRLVLLAGPPNVEAVEFYIHQQGSWRHTRAGSSVPLVAQQDLSRYPTLRFSLAPDESVQVLMKIKSHAPFHLNPVLYSNRTFGAAEIATRVSDGMLIGGMAALAWCAFSISIFMRRLPFLWLSAIAGAAALREAVARGYIQRLFWSLDSAWGYRLELTLETLCLTLFAMFIHSVARRSTVLVPGARIYAALAAVLLVCTILTAFIPVSVATRLISVAAMSLACSMLASTLLLARNTRAIAGLLGVSAFLVVLEIGIKTMKSPLGAPLISAPMILDSGMPVSALLIGGVNLAVLTLWAAHSLGAPWRGRATPRRAPAKTTAAPREDTESSRLAFAEPQAVLEATLESKEDTAQIAGANFAGSEKAADEARAGSTGGTGADTANEAKTATAGETATGEAASETSANETRRQAMILSYVGHDLRAPLATISGYTRLLRQAAAPAQHAYLDVIELSVAYQFSLIEEILAYTKVELQPFSIAPEETRLPALMEELARFGIALCTHNGNSFEYLPAATLPAMVSLDRKRLRQAVLNLLGNASKFTQEGMVRFEAKMHQGPQRTELHLHVFNDGPTIASDDKRKIFSAFRQVRRRQSGIGLGLFIVERIAHGMGGDVRLESPPNGGNCFSLIVPVRVVDPTAIPARAIRHTPVRDTYVPHVDAPPLSARLALAKLARDGELSEIEKWIGETRTAYPQCVTFYEEVAACMENFDMERLQRMALLGIA